MKEYCIHWIDSNGEKFFGNYDSYEFAYNIVRETIEFNKRNHIDQREVYVCERDVTAWRKCEGK